jgi:ribosomal protection tetracycline resistance protein
VPTLNLGIVAHVDAGKTSLTERLLFAAGVIGEIGSVDDGSTQTDTMALERQRGITIKAAVVSFALGDVTVNLIDTPGHPDFIAEVDRALGVLDGAVLVVSAVEGVQPQTRVLMRALRRLRIPALIFVNKIDRRGAGYDRVLDAISARLSPAIVAMGAVGGLGTRDACYLPFGPADHGFAARLAGRLAEHDDALLAAYVHDEQIPYRRLRAELAAQARRALVYPVFFGSAITGAGTACLAAGITEFLPTAAGDAGDPASGTVFKVERGAAGEKIAYVRMFSGILRVRDRPPAGGREKPDRVTAISVFGQGGAASREWVAAGQIGKVHGLARVRIGDVIGTPRPGARHNFSPPMLETVVVPRRPSQAGALHAALSQLAEADPLISLRQDDIRREISVSLYGEVQKEVIQATLAAEFGLDVSFRETTTVCVERPAGTGAAVDRLREPDNPFLATVGLRIDPGPPEGGVSFRLEIEPGALPLAFLRAVEETVHRTLRQGLHGWQVTGGTVTMTHSGYCPRQSHAHAQFDKSMSSTGADFRGLVPLVVMDALRRAGTHVYEPVQRFRLEVPADTTGSVLPVLARLGAAGGTPSMNGAWCILEGGIRAARVRELERRLPRLTRGEGVLECVFDHYERVLGRPPARPRSDDNPLNRKEYLLRVTRFR